MKPQTAVILIVTAGALIGFAVWSTLPDKTGAASPAGEQPGPRFLPKLTEQAADVASITIKRPDLTFTIQKGEGNTWTVPDKAGYPAKPDAVRGALVGLSDLREWEEKTDQPALYSKLGVEDPTAPPPEKTADAVFSQAMLVTVKNTKGETLADVIVGNRKYSQFSSTTGTYVRRNGEARSWLVRGAVELPREILGWVDAQFANIDRSRIRSVTVTHPGAPPLVISRDTSAAAFAVQGIPAGRELKEPGIAETIAACVTMNSFQDVAKVESVDFTGGPDGKPGPTVEVRCFDGLVINVNAVPKDGRQWWKLAASTDQSVIETNAAGDAEKIKTGTEKLNKDVQDLNAKWAPFAFAPNDYKAKSINNTLDDMLKPPTTSPPTAPTAAPPRQNEIPPPVEPESKPEE